MSPRTFESDVMEIDEAINYARTSLAVAKGKTRDKVEDYLDKLIELRNLEMLLIP